MRKMPFYEISTYNWKPNRARSPCSASITTQITPPNWHSTWPMTRCSRKFRPRAHSLCVPPRRAANAAIVVDCPGLFDENRTSSWVRSRRNSTHLSSGVGHRTQQNWLACRRGQNYSRRTLARGVRCHSLRQCGRIRWRALGPQ